MNMARGWESKSVEEQQSQSLQQPLTQEEKDRLARIKAEKMREIQALKLTLARIREQMERTTQDRYKQLLETELKHVEQELLNVES
jgi:hypothetical protein